MRSTPSRFNDSSKIRAPESFTACPPFRFLRVPPPPREFSALLEEAGRGQALRDLVDGVAVRGAEGRPARSAVVTLKVQRRLEPADAVTPGNSPIGRHHARGEGLGLVPSSVPGQSVDLAELAGGDVGE